MSAVRNISLNAFFTPSALVEQLTLLSADERALALDRLLITGLGDIIRAGPRRGGGPPPTVQLRVRLSVTRHAELVRTADLLRTSVRAVLRDVVAAADAASERAALELEYRRLRLPGDPARLSIPVLQLFLEFPEKNDPVLAAIRGLAETVEVLSKRIDVLSSRVESRRTVSNPADLLRMGVAGLRNRLRELGGRAPRNTSRGDLLSLIRAKENE